MTEPQKTNPQKAEKRSDSQGMNIDVGHLSVTGHVVFAGRDGQVNVNTGGNVDQTSTNNMTIGGIETDRQSYDSLIAALRNARQVIDKTVTDTNEHEAALQDMNNLEEQLTADKKPNPYILVRAAKALYRFSPAIAGAIVSVFSEPLAGQIVMGIGGLAIEFYDTLLNSKPTKKS